MFYTVINLHCSGLLSSVTGAYISDISPVFLMLRLQLHLLTFPLKFKQNLKTERKEGRKESKIFGITFTFLNLQHSAHTYNFGIHLF